MINNCLTANLNGESNSGAFADKENLFPVGYTTITVPSSPVEMLAIYLTKEFCMQIRGIY